LAKWGTYASDVQFILRRSGATDSSKSAQQSAQPASSTPPSSSSNFDKNQQIRQSLPTQSKSRQYSANDIRHEKSRKSLGPGMRMRGESSSSLPVNPNQALRSGSPQRRHQSPNRRIGKTRQPSPNRIRIQRAEFQRVLIEQQNLIKDHVNIKISSVCLIGHLQGFPSNSHYV